MREKLVGFIAAESGTTSIEYGLLAAGIAVVIISSLSLVSCSLNTIFYNIGVKLRSL